VVEDIIYSIATDEVRLRILYAGVGKIVDSDIRLAGSGKALVVGFRVEANKLAQKVAEQQSVTIVTFNNIYDLAQGVRSALTALVKPEVQQEIIGQFEVLKIFLSEPSRTIVGGKVIEGKLHRNVSLKVFRNEEFLGQGKAKQLKKVDKDIEEAREGEEVGILFDGSVKLQEGDKLEASEKKTVKISL
jgi:translation initiation factor IF-2